MPADTEPQLLVIGDSHTAALLAGARALGLRADGVSWSGSAWHDGKFYYNVNGIGPRDLPKARQAMEALRTRLGRAQLALPGQPVLTTLGFHLGRLVPPYGWNGHVAFARGEGWPEGADVTSRAFLRDYIGFHRRRHLRILRRWAAAETLILVSPPPSFERPSYAAFREELVALYRGEGLRVFDTVDEFSKEKNGLVPVKLLEEDGLHGTTEYGARIIRAMVREGFLDLALPE